MDFVKQAISCRFINEEFRWLECYDFENDKLVITPPDFSAHSGILRKHNYPIIEVLRESIKTIYQAEKDTEEENKNTTKKGKSKY